MSPFCASAQARLKSARSRVSASSPARGPAAASSVSRAHSRDRRRRGMQIEYRGAAGGGYAASPGGTWRRADMTFLSVDPANGERLEEHPAWGVARLERALEQAAAAAGAWAGLDRAPGTG